MLEQNIGKHSSKIVKGELAYKNIRYLLGIEKTRKGEVDAEFAHIVEASKRLVGKDPKLKAKLSNLLVAAAQSRAEGWHDKFQKTVDRINRMEEEMAEA